MAPYTYVRFALGMAPSGHIHFGSLEFADINGLAPVDGLLLGLVLCFGDMDIVADRLGRL